jgi:hypothetical protein
MNFEIGNYVVINPSTYATLTTSAVHLWKISKGNELIHGKIIGRDPYNTNSYFVEIYKGRDFGFRHGDYEGVNTIESIYLALKSFKPIYRTLDEVMLCGKD